MLQPLRTGRKLNEDTAFDDGSDDVAASAWTMGEQVPTCPLSPVDLPRLSGLAGKSALIGGKPAILTFQSKLDRDDDGAPNAYHRGLRDAGTDPGLDHICVGGSVLEFADGRLHDKYGAGGSVGQLAGIDPATGKGRSLLCKLDYLAIRDKGFPACGPGRLCMIWYGIAAEERACGFPSPFGGSGARGCGAPIRQVDASGTQTDFYLTTTALRRPGARPDTRTQADYVDAAKVPYIVLPGGLHLPQGKAGSVGDLALMVWHGRTVFTVVGDVGP